MPARRTLRCEIEAWQLRRPFAITGYTFTQAQLLRVSLREGRAAGQGEAAGVYYLGEDAERLLADVERARDAVEGGVDREALRSLLPPGGARNALDCALWDLEAKRAGTTVFELTGVVPARTETALTIGIGSPAEMAATAQSLGGRRIKLKLDDELPVERVAAVRAVRADAEIIVDVNQGWTIEQLAEYAPRLAAFDIAMIEQPLPRGDDEALETFDSPVPLCADESCLHLGEFEQAARRYQVINIKLDKAGGLTEGLALARLARARGIELMVGNMMGTSLGMAPGFVLAQLCRYVDLDGALFLTRDRPSAMSYDGGVVSPPTAALWG